LIEVCYKLDKNITTYLQYRKTYSDEFTTSGKPFGPSSFNLYLFKGNCEKFKDLITTFTTRAESISFILLYVLLLSHELINKNSFQHLSIKQDNDNYHYPTSRQPLKIKKKK
jgi:hypothetical protein